MDPQPPAGTDGGWCPPRVINLAAWQVLRGLRRSLKLSQRELAELANVPQSTISRIESQRTDPRFETLARIARSCGYAVIVARVHRGFDPIAQDVFSEGLFDRVGRRTPAHLAAWLVRVPYRDYWWGWYRLAWDPKDAAVPNHTYAERSRRDPRRWIWADVT